MLEGIIRIEGSASISEIVRNHYRTADILKKYDIDFCSSGKYSIDTICAHKGLDKETIMRELEDSAHTIAPPSLAEYQTWKPDFLVDYITHVHHQYLKKTIAEANECLLLLCQQHAFLDSHLQEFQQIFNDFSGIILPLQIQEEETIFPYIRQLTRAYHNKESYAALLVRTLRKPVHHAALQEQKRAEALIRSMRNLTGNYTPPKNACITQLITLRKFLDLDNNLVHHLYLENDVLYPQVLIMEAELMNQED